MTTPVLQSHIAGQWLGSQPAQVLPSAVNGRPVAATHAEAIDFAAAHQWSYGREAAGVMAACVAVAADSGAASVSGSSASAFWSPRYSSSLQPE